MGTEGNLVHLSKETLPRSLRPRLDRRVEQQSIRSLGGLLAPRTIISTVVLVLGQRDKWSGSLESRPQ